MAHYYNEFNQESAAMIKQFMDDGLIAGGDIDTRPIQEVKADDIKGYTQCHFFAGIAGWSFALRLAGWPEDRPVWTGSCPCQPFSSAGRQKGKADDRHLWPAWFGLVSELRPATIFGEQVASAVAHGWLDDVYEGLEGEGYAVGSAVLPASSVGAPHKRDRLWFVAHTQRNKDNKEQQRHPEDERGQGGNVGNTQGAERKCSMPSRSGRHGVARTGSNVADTESRSAGYERQDTRTASGEKHTSNNASGPGGGVSGHRDWQSGVWINCPDEKERLIEPSIPLLVDGFQSRKPILHALGNAIVPQVAAEFIKAGANQ